MANNSTSTPAPIAATKSALSTPAVAIVLATPASAAPAVVVAPTTPASAATTIAITLTQSSPPISSLWQNGTVLVAAFALVGVLITVLFAHMRMRRELEAAARNATIEREQTRDQARLDRESAALEAHKERVATTRRQVYLEAVEALGKAQMFLGGLSNQDMSKLDFQTGMGPLLIAANKVAVIGEMGTVKSARELTTMINRRFFRAIIKLLPLSRHKSSATHHRAEWEASQAEIKRILAAMTHHNETVKGDSAGFAALTNSFQTQQQRAKVASTAEQEAHAKIIKAQQDYSDFVVAGAKELSLQFDLLVDSIRRELSIETDFDMFRAQTVQMMVAVDEAVAEMKTGIKNFQESTEKNGTTE